MKTNEVECADLRIGNLISYFDDIIKVDTIDCFDGKERVGGKTKDGERVCDKPTYFEPIELTEEVLVKIGFEKLEKLFRMKLSKFHLDYFIAVGVLRIYKKLTDCYFDKNLEFKCEYLHQLQNAYYCITNEELEVSL